MNQISRNIHYSLLKGRSFLFLTNVGGHGNGRPIYIARNMENEFMWGFFWFGLLQSQEKIRSLFIWTLPSSSVVLAGVDEWSERIFRSSKGLFTLFSREGVPRAYILYIICTVSTVGAQTYVVCYEQHVCRCCTGFATPRSYCFSPSRQPSHQPSFAVSFRSGKIQTWQRGQTIDN